MSTDHITADWLRDAIKRAQNPGPPGRRVLLLHPDYYADCVRDGLISADDPDWSTTQNLPTAHNAAYAAHLPSFYQVAKIYGEWIENARQNASQDAEGDATQGNATKRNADEAHDERTHDA